MYLVDLFSVFGVNDYSILSNFINNMDKETIDSISYVQMSKYRMKVLIDLKEGLKIPSLISESTGIRINHVSRALKELKDKKLIVLLNPEKTQGRLYQITKLGKEVLKYIEQ